LDNIVDDRSDGCFLVDAAAAAGVAVVESLVLGGCLP
jgi:hypothetical protein